MADTIQLKPLNARQLHLRITSLSPLITHRFSEKVVRMLREKKQGKKTKNREASNPEEEMQSAMYRLKDGRCGVRADGLKKALFTAAHKDIGVPKTLLKKGLFIRADEHSPEPLVALSDETDEPVMREDPVRVGMGSTDLRYRPEFTNWSVDLRIEYDADLLTPEDIVNLINRAGFGVGLGEWRPECNGDFGRFCVDAEKGVEVTR